MVDLWNKAKAKAKLLNKTDDWLFIYDIYTKLGGKNKQIIAVINNNCWTYIKTLDNDDVLTMNAKGEELILTQKQFFLAKKIFKDISVVKNYGKNKDTECK